MRPRRWRPKQPIGADLDVKTPESTQKKRISQEQQHQRFRIHQGLHLPILRTRRTRSRERIMQLYCVGVFKSHWTQHLSSLAQAGA